MMGKLEKLCEHLKGRGFGLEAEVREYLKTKVKITDDALMDKVVGRLVAENAIRPEPKKKDKDYFIPTYRKAVAQFFKTGRLPMSRKNMWMEMAYKLDWFRPDDAKTFLGFCERDGLLEERDGKMHPTFDVSEIDLPMGWSLHEELNIKTGQQQAEDERKKKEHEEAVRQAEEESLAQLSEVLAEDGIEVDVVGDVEAEHDDIEEIMTLSTRTDDKARVIKELVKVGLPGKAANGAFDYYELNAGITNQEAFMVAMVQFEGFKDETKLGRAYDILLKEGCFGFEI